MTISVMMMFPSIQIFLTYLGFCSHLEPQNLVNSVTVFMNTLREREEIENTFFFSSSVEITC